LRAPAAWSSSISCTFTASSVVRRNDALLARAAEVGNGEIATEDMDAPAAEELASGDGFATEEAEPEVPAAEVPVEAEPPTSMGSRLYVGNLPWSCDSEQLAEILMDYGAVEAVEVVYEQDTRRSRGFAFVTMASNADARAVIKALDGADLGGRAMRVNFPIPTRNNPRVFNPGQRRPGNVNKMFVGNLPWATDEEALIHLFSDHGQVVEAKVVYDRETGRSRGFGFVVMGSAEDVNSAVENLNGIEYEGRLLRVDKVENKPPPRQD
jgi:nucleolin